MIAPCTWAIRTSKPASFKVAMPQIAKVAARNEKVPPCTIGSRFPRVVCSHVVMPLTKNIVPMSWASFRRSSAMPSGSARSSGMATVEPNIVR